jgi:enamine deaminase RidA (YjgF/YER057c/UK114 family)
MNKQVINPWTWQEEWGFSQAWKVDGPHSVVYVAGQTGVDADGDTIHAGDFDAECRLMFENMRTVLEQSGASLENVVKLTVFIADMGKIDDYTRIKREFFPGDGPTQSAIGVVCLALPDLTLEVEAVAVV